jgi:hypothetical protein
VPNMDFRPSLREVYQSFSGPDPWEHDRPTTWSLNGYQMETSSMKPRYPPGRISTQAVFVGIESGDHGRYRILPMALQDLWHEGVLRGPELPALLHAIEQDLRISDYPPPFKELYLKILSIACAALALLAAGVATWTELYEPFYFFDLLTAGVLPMTALTLPPAGLLISCRLRRRRLASRYRTLLARAMPSAPAEPRTSPLVEAHGAEDESKEGTPREALTAGSVHDMTSGSCACLGKDGLGAIECFRGAQIVARLVDESHFGVNVVRCAQCGQHFATIFCERIDWADGDDPQTWIGAPVSEDEAHRLVTANVAAEESVLLDIVAGERRILVQDRPKGEQPTLQWKSRRLYIPGHD